MALACPSCEAAAAEYVGMADDGRNEMKCGACDHHWFLGAKPVSPRAVTPKPPKAARPTTPRASRATGTRSGSTGTTGATRPVTPSTPAAPPVVVRFPTLDDVPGESLQRLASLKGAWPRQRPRPDPYAADFRRLYELMFSRAGLPHAEPGQLKDFVTTDVLALSGNTSSFSREWRRLGDRDASERFRNVVEYLLRGESGDDEGGADGGAPDDPPLEDRFTALAEQRSPYSMGGVRESILTHVLAVARPDRFLPLLRVDSGPGGEGKRDIARTVLGVEIPAVDRARHTSGRVACGSNDLLVDALGAGFSDLDDAAAFLLWAHAEG
ncbi:hypothetical protein LQ327_28130 [Actinomycetospora endophytica]|uniref:Zinc finger/thioredoxin putative domain-containing protein n=1 Tax=Actinomycetospora endophytica TaxID=2291215 RepID=A0ABS8PG63_9PSEU|nr:hypothetical protein [Actinomycetospora endophytica]MCD2197247.1 hypothetical protein [Actinomycetospora endophytica]